MTISTIKTVSLSGDLLDFWIAFEQGHPVVGRALREPHYEVTNEWLVSPRQLPSATRGAETSEGYVMLSHCCCADYAEMYPDGNSSWASVHGHLTACLAPVPEYHKDWDRSGPILQHYWRDARRALGALYDEAEDLLAQDLLLWGLRGVLLCRFGSELPADVCFDRAVMSKRLRALPGPPNRLTS